MIPQILREKYADERVPRTRGDDPYDYMTNLQEQECSPHTRG